MVLRVADELETMTGILDTGEWNNHHRIVLLLTTQRGFSVTLIDTYLMRQAWSMYANEMNNSELTRSAVARVFLNQLATLWTLFPSFCLSQTQDFLCRFVFGASSAIRSILKDRTSFG